VDQLTTVIDDAPDPAARTAATVVAAAGLIEDGRPDDALPLLTAMMAHDAAEPVDHAWLTVQHARACVGVGRIDDVQTAMINVQPIRLTHPGDVTATAIAGAASQLLFSASANPDETVCRRHQFAVVSAPAITPDTDGPLAAVSLAAAEVRLNASTRTTAPADLALLCTGGEVLDETTANRSVFWLLATLDDPSSFATRTRSGPR